MPKSGAGQSRTRPSPVSRVCSTMNGRRGSPLLAAIRAMSRFSRIGPAIRIGAQLEIARGRQIDPAVDDDGSCQAAALPATHRGSVLARPSRDRPERSPAPRRASAVRPPRSRRVLHAPCCRSEADASRRTRPARGPRGSEIWRGPQWRPWRRRAPAAASATPLRTGRAATAFPARAGAASCPARRLPRPAATGRASASELDESGGGKVTPAASLASGTALH